MHLVQFMIHNYYIDIYIGKKCLNPHKTCKLDTAGPGDVKKELTNITTCVSTLL